MSYYRGNHRMCKAPAALSSWGVPNPERYWRALERINRRAAATQRPSLTLCDIPTWQPLADNDADTDQSTLPFPLG